MFSCKVLCITILTGFEYTFINPCCGILWRGGYLRTKKKEREKGKETDCVCVRV